MGSGRDGLQDKTKQQQSEDKDVSPKYNELSLKKPRLKEVDGAQRECGKLAIAKMRAACPLPRLQSRSPLQPSSLARPTPFPFLFTLSPTLSHPSALYSLFMLSRLNLITRHFPRSFGLSRPTASTPFLVPRPGPSAMTSATNAKPIHTAACLIIGDEVLGGKVRASLAFRKTSGLY